jgi:hypothetical protein
LPTIVVGEGWREKHDYQVLEREINFQACAYHAPMCGRRKTLQRVPVEAEDVCEPTGETRVAQKLT